MFGMMKDTLINRFIWEIFPLPEWIECTRKAVFHLHNMKGMEFTLNPDDKILNVTTSHIMNEGESLIGFMFLIQDITGERKRDEYLQRVNRLISLGELAAGIAHEIRNPLTGIGVVLDFLSRKKLPRRDLELILSLIHISEPTRLLSISYAVFCLKKKTQKKRHTKL